MAEYPTYPDPTRTTGGSRADGATTDEILAVIVAEEPHGITADSAARALGLALDGKDRQADLEDLVAHGLLDRRGLDHGAVYTRAAATHARLT